MEIQGNGACSFPSQRLVFDLLTVLTLTPVLKGAEFS
jgi:hypothetical protein